MHQCVCAESAELRTGCVPLVSKIDIRKATISSRLPNTSTAETSIGKSVDPFARSSNQLNRIA